MVSREQMLEEAATRGYGAGRSLVATFINWQRRGLVARATGKAARRGGEGLWHERQLWIWLSLLHLRSQGAHLQLLANVPVGCWMLGVEGVDTDQIQKVMLEFWGKSKPLPDIARSPTYRRQVDRAVDWMAAPGARPRDRQRYRRTLAHASAAMPDLGVSAEAFAQAAAGVIAPGGKPSPAQVGAISSTYGLFETRALAVAQLPKLARPTNEVVRFWEWARRTFQRTWSAYAAAQQQLAAQPGVGHLYDPADATGLELLTWNGCTTILTVLGIGLEVLRSHDQLKSGLEAPPPLSWWSAARAPRAT